MKKKESEKMQQLESLISADAQNREDVGSLRLQLSGKVLRLSYFNKMYLFLRLSFFYIFIGHRALIGRPFRHGVTVRSPSTVVPWNQNYLKSSQKKISYRIVHASIILLHILSLFNIGQSDSVNIVSD